MVLKLKAQPTVAFVATVNQMFGGSSPLLTTAEHCEFGCMNCAQMSCQHMLGSGLKLGGADEHLIDSSEKCICRLSLEFRVRMLLKGALLIKADQDEQ